MLFCQSLQTDAGPVFCLDLDERVHLVVRVKESPVEVELQKAHALPSGCQRGFLAGDVIQARVIRKDRRDNGVLVLPGVGAQREAAVVGREPARKVDPVCSQLLPDGNWADERLKTTLSAAYYDARQATSWFPAVFILFA